MSTVIIEAIVSDFDSELWDDKVGLWRIARALRESDLDLEHRDIRLYAADVCRRLLDTGAALGQFGPNLEFETWDRSSAVDRMLIGWSDLRRDPTIGDVAWLRRDPSDYVGPSLRER